MAKKKSAGRNPDLLKQIEAIEPTNDPQVLHGLIPDKLKEAMKVLAKRFGREALKALIDLLADEEE